MKLITAIIEQVSVGGLATALPTAGVVSMTISDVQRYQGGPVAVEVHRGVKLPKFFTRLFRVELLVDDDNVEQVVDGIHSASESGRLGTTRLSVAGTDRLVAV